MSEREVQRISVKSKAVTVERIDVSSNRRSVGIRYVAENEIQLSGVGSSRMYGVIRNRLEYVIKLAVDFWFCLVYNKRKAILMSPKWTKRLRASVAMLPNKV